MSFVISERLNLSSCCKSKTLFSENVMLEMDGQRSKKLAATAEKEISVGSWERLQALAEFVSILSSQSQI